MQSVIKRPCPATRIHFQPYGQPNVERKTTTGERHPAETRGRHICRPYSDYVNCIRRAGCPHPAASSRGYRSTGSHPRRGRRPRRPGNLPSPLIPGKTPGHARPLPRGGGQAPCRPQTPAEGSRPLPTNRPINECPPPCRAAVRERRQKNRGDPFSRDCLGSLYKAI